MQALHCSRHSMAWHALLLSVPQLACDICRFLSAAAMQSRSVISMQPAPKASEAVLNRAVHAGCRGSRHRRYNPSMTPSSGWLGSCRWCRQIGTTTRLRMSRSTGSCCKLLRHSSAYKSRLGKTSYLHSGVVETKLCMCSLLEPVSAVQLGLARVQLVLASMACVNGHVSMGMC